MLAEAVDDVAFRDDSCDPPLLDDGNRTDSPLAFLALSCVAMLWNPLGRRSSGAPEVAGAAV